MKDEHDPGTIDLEEAIYAKTRPRALGAWIFAGGFTLGVKRYFDVACVLEESNYGVATATHNNPEIPVHYGTEKWPLDHLAKEPWDFIYSNPACAAWSQAGKVAFGADWRVDPRVCQTKNSFELLRKFKPHFWAWESVVPAFVRGRELVDDLTRQAVGTGYSVTYLLHNAQYLGVPQRRERFFFVAHDVKFHVEEPDWGATRTCGDLLREMNDVGERDMVLSPAIEALFPRLEPGDCLRDLWERENPPELRKLNARGQTVGRPPFTYHRLDATRPSNTVAGFYLVHPTEDRCLTTKEMAALCGFPSDYEFIGSGKCNQLARGVCPPVGEWLARSVKRSLEMSEPNDARVTLVDYRRPPGTTETLPVPTTTFVAPVPVQTVETARPEPRPPAPPRGAGSGARIRELLAAGGLSRQQIVDKIHAEFPRSKTTTKDVAWNAAKMRRDGPQAPRVAAEPPPQPAPEKAPEAPPTAARQPTRSKRVVPDRQFDKTSLTETSHGYRVHRDYAAHFFRWGFASRAIDNTMDVLDVGCGVDCPFVKVLVGAYAKGVPKRYVGVDMNRLPRAPQRPWATFLEEFDFTSRYDELGQFDRIINFEVLEHMDPADGKKLLVGLRECLKPDGKLYLSTPVFDGTAAANHKYEWRAQELKEAFEEAKMHVVKRYGTFANYREIKKVCTAEQLTTLDKMNEFYSTDVSACFLAPLYPDSSRNNVWVVERG